MVEGNASVKILYNSEGGIDVVFVLPDGSERLFGSVFTDIGCAESFAERVNRLGISAVHIEDILEDALP